MTTHANRFDSARESQKSYESISRTRYDGRRLISERRVGAMLGFSKRTLQRWRQENKGPPWVKIGRRIYYDEDKLNAWIRDH
jgi:predicted DNA-binding transcriptional regulator AlpA